MLTLNMNIIVYFVLSYNEMNCSEVTIKISNFVACHIFITLFQLTDNCV